MYTPDLDRLHIRWALAGWRRFPHNRRHYSRIIRFALARLAANKGAAP